MYSEGFCFVFFLPVMWPSEIPKLPTDPLWEGFLLCGKFSCFITSSSEQVSIPNSYVYFFVSYILSYLLFKIMGCLYGYLVSSASVQKLFCGSCLAFKWSFDEFVGEKVYDRIREKERLIKQKREPVNLKIIHLKNW